MGSTLHCARKGLIPGKKHCTIDALLRGSKTRKGHEMSLKVEQILDDFSFSKSEPRIYTTGAHLVPMIIKEGTKQRYVWVVEEFDGCSYQDGILCSPRVYAAR